MAKSRPPRPCIICSAPTRNGSRCTTHAIPPLGRRTWNELSARILNDDNVCWICHKPGADTLDHLIPRARGGPDTTGNLRPAHRACNSRRGAK